MLVDPSGTPCVDCRPKHPFSNIMMAEIANQGDYTYSTPASGTFRLVGHTSNGIDWTVP